MPLSPTDLVLLQELAARLGAECPAPRTAPASDSALIRLDDASSLVALAAADVRRELDQAQRPLDRDEVARALAAASLPLAPVALFAATADAAACIAATARRRKRGATRILGDAAGPFAGVADAQAMPFAPGAPSLDAAALADASLLVVTPDLPGEQLAALCAAAHAAGVAVCFDETATAFRVAAATVARDAQPRPDYVLLGPSLAAGLPFAAAIGCEGGADPSDVTLAVVHASLRALTRAPVHAATAAGVQRLALAIAAAAKGQEIDCALVGHASMPRLVFHGQEGAPGPLIAQRFAAELEEAGVRLDGPLLLPAALRDDALALDAAAAAFEHAFVRIRALLVEYNSHLSGGLPWPFATGRDALRARGLTFYRFPRLGEVDVEPRGEAMRIAFGKSALGPVTSSGFFVPTRLVGDVTLTIRYALRQWNAGPDSACLGLFFQNEASTARYYAQVISTADAPSVRSVAAGIAGEVVGRRTVDGDEGWLRLARVGSQMQLAWRAAADAPWIQLGSCPATGDALIAGCKIWSKVATDGLVADLYDLEIEGELAQDQPELLAARPDPRHEAPGS